MADKPASPVASPQGSQATRARETGSDMTGAPQEMTASAVGEEAVNEGCYCGHGPYHHEAGDWPYGPINGRCSERGCDCSTFERKRS